MDYFSTVCLHPSFLGTLTPSLPQPFRLILSGKENWFCLLTLLSELGKSETAKLSFLAAGQNSGPGAAMEPRWAWRCGENLCTVVPEPRFSLGLPGVWGGEGAVHSCVCGTRNQPWKPSTLDFIFEAGLLAGIWGSHIILTWLVNEPHDHLYILSQKWDPRHAVSHAFSVGSWGQTHACVATLSPELSPDPHFLFLLPFKLGLC